MLSSERLTKRNKDRFLVLARSTKLTRSIEITATPFKYLKSLDKPTRRRITEKLKALAEDPTNVRLSLPLTASDKRRARVGAYRILFTFNDTTLTVSDIKSIDMPRFISAQRRSGYWHKKKTESHSAWALIPATLPLSLRVEQSIKIIEK